MTFATPEKWKFHPSTPDSHSFIYMNINSSSTFKTDDTETVFFFFFAFLFFVGFFVCLMFFFSLTIFIMNLINLEFLFVESDDPSLMTDLDTAYRNMMKVVDTNDADVSITFLLWSHLEIENLMQHWNK